MRFRRERKSGREADRVALSKYPEDQDDQVRTDLWDRMASMYAVTRPGKSSTGPYNVKTFRNRGPEIARSHPWPDWDLKSERRHVSNEGLHRFTTDRTASAS